MFVKLTDWCSRTIYFPVKNSFSTSPTINFSRSCRFEWMFFEILFWCLVLFSHAIPKYTQIWHALPFDGACSIWYLKWSWNDEKVIGELWAEKHSNQKYIPGIYSWSSYIEMVTKWNPMESQDFFNNPTISIRKERSLLGTHCFSSITGNTLIKFVANLPHIYTVLIQLPWS